MRLRVLIVPDKFKGTLTAQVAAESIARGWGKMRPQDQLQLLPMSDGGDGFGAVMSALIGAVQRTVRTCDAAHRPCAAPWWWQARSRTAVLDTAGVVGLAMLPPGAYHPFALDTFGLGAVVRAAIRMGAKRCLVGLGGSATNDAGFGLARALGWQFLDRCGDSIEQWPELASLAELHPPLKAAELPELVIAVDVQNPLLGRRGATRVYGPQKGLKPRDFPTAERALRRLAYVVRRHRGSNLAGEPGAGSAGGLGFGFAAFLGGRLEPGFELFAGEAKLEQIMRGVDLVITGEGAIDRSTIMGKGAGCVAALASKLRIPCVGLCGKLDHATRYKNLFQKIGALVDLTTVEQARTKPALWLERLAKKVASDWSGSPPTTGRDARKVL